MESTPPDKPTHDTNATHEQPITSRPPRESAPHNDNNYNRRPNTYKPNFNGNREGRPFQGQQIKRNAAPRSRRPADNRPKLPNTVYNAVAQFKPVDGFGRKDLRKISNIIKTKYHETFGEVEPEKVEQTEYDGKVYQVYCYPEPLRKDIRSVVHWYFKVKKERGTKHERVVKLEGLEKMKRVGSPDYEMALVKFNMAEEERRKQEKLAQAEKVKKDQLRAKYAKDTRDRRENGNKPQYNRDRAQNYKGHPQNNRSGQFDRNNNQYQNRPQYNKPREFNKEDTPVAPPPVSANISETPSPTVNEVPNSTPPKPGFLESFLNKIKGKDE